MKSQRVELLAPAANLAVGIAAIDAGADAVYIGGPAFGARSAAGNSMEEIKTLCHYAHLFGVRIFLTLNTLVERNEVEHAVAIAWEAYNAGVDAIIVQDFSLLDAGLPPIELHASTQCFNFEVDKVLALERAGFKRVVLERALSGAEIRSICDSTNVEIEVFIHGAICVGYSGRCNFSEHLTGRSGNRGQCAQPCRSLYDLVDGSGRVLFKNEALLSPRDMNLSAQIGDLVDAGVCSLKIEGRLKDAAYVSNITAHYNQILNDLGVDRTSVGRSTPNFTPNVALSFNRGFTQWFYNGTAAATAAGVAVAGSVGGQFIGVVSQIGDRFFTVKTDIELDNGDGIAFIGDNGDVAGVRVNKVDGNRIFPLNMAGIAVGTRIFRTFSTKFNPTCRRAIDVDIEFLNDCIIAADIYGTRASVPLPADSDAATNRGAATANIIKSLSKSGDTIFAVRNVKVSAANVPFIPISQLNALRRQLLDNMSVNRVHREPTAVSPPILPPENTAYLMRSRYCILREKGLCLKQNKGITLPLSLINNGRKIDLKFDCAACEMSLIAPNA